MRCSIVSGSPGCEGEGDSRESPLFLYNRRFARALLLLAAGGLALASAALAGPAPTRCQTYYEATLNRWHTICSDGTRGLNTYNKTLQRWDTTITPPLEKGCTGIMNPRTQQVDVQCR